LKEAEIHCLSGENNSKQYVMAASGLDLETVQKVPQLHLARLWLTDGNRIHGAKVVNRTLGDCSHVCERLLDAALSDAVAGPEQAFVEGWSTLHGLSEWVLQQQNSSDSLSQSLHNAIANNESSSSGASENDNEIWEKVAMDFVNQGWSDESNLYREKGLLNRIEHNADTSDFANTCRGSMAVFRFTT
jgi:hypothetical protein